MARTSKSRGASGFQMRSGNASPYKFLGKVGKALGGVAGAVGGALGIGQGGVNSGNNVVGPMNTGGVPMAEAQKALAGHHQAMGAATALFKKSPMKAADALLISGAYDAASGHGTKALANIAEARALTNMVNSVEETVNRSSRAQNRKDRTRQKVQDRSHHRYGKFRKRKGDEWYSESADHMHTPPHGF